MSVHPCTTTPVLLFPSLNSDSCHRVLFIFPVIFLVLIFARVSSVLFKRISFAFLQHLLPAFVIMATNTGYKKTQWNISTLAARGHELGNRGCGPSIENNRGRNRGNDGSGRPYEVEEEDESMQEELSYYQYHGRWSVHRTTCNKRHA